MYKPSRQQAPGKMLTQIAEEPWATVCADFVGPLPRSKHGNTTILVFIDKFSKWVEIVPLRKATTEGLIKAFRERILTRFGVLKIMITDNGTQFTSKEFKRLL
uniref:Retrotransposable element Tf2 155 kDa protein type 1 n=1 Tax=Ceratitis capitata TaxID=7213 RepID=W8C7N8_CERCA